MNKEIVKKLKDSLDYEFDLSFNDRKELLSYIKELQEDNEHLKRLCETQNNREYRSKFLKEFQEEHGKNVYPDYDEIYKRYDEMKAELQEANDSVTWWQNRYNAVERDKKQLENNRDKALKIIDSYELGKYDYSIPPGGIIELREALKGGSDE